MTPSHITCTWQVLVGDRAVTCGTIFAKSMIMDLDGDFASVVACAEHEDQARGAFGPNTLVLDLNDDSDVDRIFQNPAIEHSLREALAA